MSFETDLQALLEKAGVEIEADTIGAMVGIVEGHVSQVTEQAVEHATQIATTNLEEYKTKLDEEYVEKMKALDEAEDATNMEYIKTKMNEQITALKSELVDSNTHEKMIRIMEGLKGLIKDYLNEDISIDEVGSSLDESVAISKAEKLAEQHNILKTDYDKLIENNTQISKELNQVKRELIFNTLIAEMEVSTIDSEKIKNITEHVKYDSLEDFKKGVTLMIEALCKTAKVAKTNLKESIEVLSTKDAKSIINEAGVEDDESGTTETAEVKKYKF